MANKVVPQTLNSSGVYDKLITAISSGGTGAESESAAVKNLISGLTSTSPTSDDLIPFQDVSSGGAGKTTLSALASALQSVRGYAKIQTGSYVGTGTYGASNPCSLTFAFTPQIIFLYNKNYGNPTTIHSQKETDQSIVFYIANIGDYSAYFSSTTKVSYYINIVFQNSNVKWYADTNKTNYKPTAEAQYNELNTEYYYYTFG